MIEFGDTFSPLLSTVAENPNQPMSHTHIDILDFNYPEHILVSSQVLVKKNVLEE